MRRLWSVATVCLLFVSCREIQPFQPVTTIQGFRLDGIVTAQNGIPLKDVQVILYYYYDYYSTTPVDTQKVIVQSTTKVVDIAVYTVTHILVRQIYFGYHAPGPMAPVLWDGLDAQGKNVPSGEYLMRYALDGVVAKYSILVVDGTVTASTDSTGKFSVSGSTLPVNAVFDAYFSNGKYDASYIVLPEVDILIRGYSTQKLYSAIELATDQVTTIAMTLE